MKKLLLVFVLIMLAGCVAFPGYDDGYYYPYGTYPYGYVGSNVNLFVSNFNGRHHFHDGGHDFRGGAGHGFHGGGGHNFQGSGHWGGGRH